MSLLWNEFWNFTGVSPEQSLKPSNGMARMSSECSSCSARLLHAGWLEPQIPVPSVLYLDRVQTAENPTAVYHLCFRKVKGRQANDRLQVFLLKKGTSSNTFVVSTLYQAISNWGGQARPCVCFLHHLLFFGTLQILVTWVSLIFEHLHTLHAPGNSALAWPCKCVPPSIYHYC